MPPVSSLRSLRCLGNHVSCAKGTHFIWTRVAFFGIISATRMGLTTLEGVCAKNLCDAGGRMAWSGSRTYEVPARRASVGRAMKA
eukprot:33913-Amphidinium_carterae.1